MANASKKVPPIAIPWGVEGEDDVEDEVEDEVEVEIEIAEGVVEGEPTEFCEELEKVKGEGEGRESLNSSTPFSSFSPAWLKGPPPLAPTPPPSW